MRTTLSLDDDVYHAVREQARLEGRSAGQVISELARASLGRRATETDDGGTRDHQDDRSLYGFAPLPRRGGVVTNELVDELRDVEGV